MNHQKKQTIHHQKGNVIFVMMFLFFVHVSIYATDEDYILLNEDSLKMSIIKNGDEKSYYDLMLFFNENHQKYLDYSLIMANNYKNGLACLDVYEEIMYLYSKKNIVIDSISYVLPISYLEKGVSYNSSECMNELAKLYSDSTLFLYDRKKASKYSMMSYESSLEGDLVLLKEKGVYSNARVIWCNYVAYRSIYVAMYLDKENKQRGIMDSYVPLNVGDTIPIVFYPDTNIVINCPSKYIETPFTR